MHVPDPAAAGAIRVFFPEVEILGQLLEYAHSTKITTQDPVGLPYLCVSSVSARFVTQAAPVHSYSIIEGG